MCLGRIHSWNAHRKQQQRFSYLIVARREHITNEGVSTTRATNCRCQTLSLVLPSLFSRFIHFGLCLWDFCLHIWLYLVPIDSRRECWMLENWIYRELWKSIWYLRSEPWFSAWATSVPLTINHLSNPMCLFSDVKIF